VPTYIHQHPDWPAFIWDTAQLAGPLAAVRHRQGRLLGHMEGLGFSLKQEAVLETLTDDVLKTSEIEGERLDSGQVRSSIARRLGIDIGALKPADRNVDGVVEMMLDATRHYKQPLTPARLFSWHAALFPTGRRGLTKIKTGARRDDASGPMQVVSGYLGRERVHYEAPAASKLNREMKAFLAWFNTKASNAKNSADIDPVLRAALAHLWFVTVHPFDDGNGRIARAIADMTLARSEDSPQRFYSMSAQIRLERNAYYNILEQTQAGITRPKNTGAQSKRSRTQITMDITPWMEWFLGCLGRAIDGAQTALSGVLAKARFWESIAGISINDRQRQMLNRLMDRFEGNLTNAKWAKLAKCSPDTALRDLQHLVDHNILIRSPEGGRSTSYSLRSL
jgi:Fic family protein